MKYAWIERNRRHWPISLACEVLGVSPSGYHERKAREIGDTSRPRRNISNDEPVRNFVCEAYPDLQEHVCRARNRAERS
jgi:hypothetical protein